MVLSSYHRWIREWQAMVCAMFWNYELDRSYENHHNTGRNAANLRQQPGFTEVWGISKEEQEEKSQQKDGDHGSSSSNGGRRRNWADTKLTDEIPFLSVTPDHNKDGDIVILWQHRPAWAEQLVLRAAGISYHIINLPYAVTEATGPLPCLLHAKNHSSNKNNNGNEINDEPPIFLGRKQRYPPISSSVFYDSKNALLDYIVDHLVPEETNKNGIMDKKSALGFTATAFGDNDKNNNNKNNTLPLLLQHLIITVLPTCWKVLTYQETQAWFAIHRPQCVESYAAGSSFFRLPFTGLFQTFCERHFALLNMSSSDVTVHVNDDNNTGEQALLQATHAYQVLEQELAKAGDAAYYILGTQQLTILDALLWDHLMQALANVHLVTILVKHCPCLVQYVERLWKNVFVAATVQQSNNSNNNNNNIIIHTQELNDIVNAQNPFVVSDIILSSLQMSSGANQSKRTILNPDMVHALDLMQSLAVMKSLNDTKAAAATTTTTLGGDNLQQRLAMAMANNPNIFLSSSSSSSLSKKASQMHPQQQQPSSSSSSYATSAADAAALATHRRGDELWLASTALATVAAFSYAVFLRTGGPTANT